MKVFITGATGYIGQRLALNLADAGHQVRALVRSPAKAGTIQHPNISFIEGSLSDGPALEAGTAGTDAVFHLAAYARVWAADPATYENINVEGTENVLQAALNNKVKKVVVTSTAGVVGPSGRAPAAEDSERQAPFFNEYEETKHRSEQVCREYARRGLEVVVVSPARVYGPGLGSESNPVTKLIDRFVHGSWRWVPGDGKGIGSYAFIDDVVAGHLLALEKGRSGEVYLLGGENASYSNFFGKLQQVSGVRKRLIHVPLGVLLLLSNLMVLWARLTRKPPLITPKWVRKYLYDWEVSSQKAINELGYPVTSLEEGIAQTIVWLKEEYEQ